MAQIDQVHIPSYMQPIAGASLGGVAYTPEAVPGAWDFEPREWMELLTPLVGGLLAGAAAVFALKGQDRLSTVLLSSWGLLTAVGGTAMVLRDIEDRRMTRQLLLAAQIQ